MKTRTESVAIDCDCTPQRPHGTQHGYIKHRCRCEPCREYNRKYHKLIRVSPRLVPADTVRNRVLVLNQRGMSSREIGRRVGVAGWSISRIGNGETRKVRPALRDAIMSIRLPSV